MRVYSLFVAVSGNDFVFFRAYFRESEALTDARCLNVAGIDTKVERSEV